MFCIKICEIIMEFLLKTNTEHYWKQFFYVVFYDIIFETGLFERQ